MHGLLALPRRLVLHANDFPACHHAVQRQFNVANVESRDKPKLISGQAGQSI